MYLGFNGFFCHISIKTQPLHIGFIYFIVCIIWDYSSHNVIYYLHVYLAYLCVYIYDICMNIY